MRDTLEKELCIANAEYAECFEEGDLLPLTVSALQNETYLLYRDIMAFKGMSPSQLKPVHVAGNVFQTRFFNKFIEEDLVCEAEDLACKV